MAGGAEALEPNFSLDASDDHDSSCDQLQFSLPASAIEPVTGVDLFTSSLENWQAEATSSEPKTKHPDVSKKRRVSRATLTLEMKVKILEEMERGRSRQLICKEYDLPPSTLSEILKRKDEIMFAVSSSVFTPKRKRMRTSKYNDLETEVFEWYVEKTRKKGITITGPEICCQAKTVAAKMNLDGFTPNNGWLCRFKQRRGIQSTPRPKVKASSKADIEDASDSNSSKIIIVRPQAMGTWTSKILPEIMRRYQPQDIFTAGETSLFFRCTPDKMASYLGEDCSCGKFAKDRLTILVATNMLGTEKLPVLAIGKHIRPRCFKNLKTIPVEYMANVKAWMIPPFFIHWVKKLDKAMLEEGRNIVLFVKPSESHPRVPDLQAVSLIFLPPDSHFQPASQGILQTLKQNYRRSIIQRHLHIAEVDGPNEECRISLVDALHWLRAAWKDVPPQTIYKSFENAEFILPRYDSLVPHRFAEASQDIPSSSDAFQLECDVMIGNNGQIIMDAEYNHMFDRLAKQTVLDPYITAESYASLDDQVVTYGYMTEEELLTEGAKTLVGEDDDDDEDEEEIREPPPPTKFEAKECLAKLAKFFATEKGTEKYFDKISCLYRHVNQVSTASTESTIIDLFSKKAKNVPKKKKASNMHKPVFVPM